MNAIYCRVSTEEQANTGYSIGAQLKACRDRYTTMGIDSLTEYIDDGYSGEFIERPALDQLRADMRAKKISRIMIYDPDRMSRNLTVQLIVADEIEKLGIELFFVTGDYDCSPEGKLFFNMKGAISAYEKAKIRERTMSGKRAKARAGKLTFNDSPLGYDYDSAICNYIINPVEAETIKLIFNMYMDENIGTIPLSIKLKAMGVQTKRGNWFSGGTIYKILKNEMYAGTKQAFMLYDKKISQYKKKKTKRDPSEWIPIPVPAIVSQDQYDAVQIKMGQNKIMASRRAKHDYLLRGKVICGHCGYAMIGSTSNKKNHTYHYYVCTSKTVYKRPCESKMIRSDEYDQLVWDKLVECAENGFDFSSQQSPAINIDKLKQSLRSLEQKQAAVTKWMVDETITIPVADAQLQTIKKEMDIIQAMIKEKKPTKIVFIPDDILSATTFEQKRKKILELGFRISLTKGVIDFKP